MQIFKILELGKELFQVCKQSFMDQCLDLSLLKISYLLGYWEIVYAYQPDERTVSIAQFGILLAKFGSVV
jgi:hypothetical protein